VPIGSNHRGTRRNRNNIIWLLTFLIVLILAGCSSSSVEGTGSQNDARTNPPERPTLRIGMLNIVDTASFYLAQERGFFRDEGLTVEPVQTRGGAAAIPGIIGGSLDVTFGNYVSFFLAQSQGIGRFRLISDGYEASPNTFVLLARPDGAVRRPSDLAGRRVAVNTFSNIVELSARSALQTHGVDPRTVQFVEVPFPDMTAALATGQVDAAAMVEPFITSASRSLGAIPILDTASGPTADIVRPSEHRAGAPHLHPHRPIHRLADQPRHLPAVSRPHPPSASRRPDAAVRRGADPLRRATAAQAVKCADHPCRAHLLRSTVDPTRM
jgi:NitT/TauT family transport system substrate-binding protein